MIQNHIEKLKISTGNLNLSLSVLTLTAPGIIFSLLYHATQSSQAQMSTSGCVCYTGSQHKVGAHLSSYIFIYVSLLCLQMH